LTSVNCRKTCAIQPLRPLRAIAERDNVHIDGCEGSVGDGAADGTGESESRVQVKASGSGRVSGRELSLRGIDLAGAGGGGRRVGGHFAGMDEKRRKWSGEVWWLKLDRRRLRARDS